MLQLHILTGKKAGVTWDAPELPLSVGRSAAAGLRLEEPGVWDRHFQIELRGADGFVLSADPQTFVTINGAQTREARLRNGDVIEIGELKMRFGFTPPRPRGLRWREWMVWAGLVLLCASQIALVYWLAR